MKYKLYGIPNCDTVKMARKFLELHQHDYEFINFKKTVPKADWLRDWKTFLGEVPINKRGTTYRKIKNEYETADLKGKMKLLIDHPSSIKRPILETKNGTLAIGYIEKEWQKLLWLFSRPKLSQEYHYDHKFLTSGFHAIKLTPLHFF